MTEAGDKRKRIGREVGAVTYHPGVEVPFKDIEVGHTPAPQSYVLTEEVFRQYREATEDPRGSFPNIAVRGINQMMRTPDGRNTGGFLAGESWEFVNPPRVGKRIMVTGGVMDKYVRRGKRLFVIDGWSVDEDGYVISHTRSTRCNESLPDIEATRTPKSAPVETHDAARELPPLVKGLRLEKFMLWENLRKPIWGTLETQSIHDSRELAVAAGLPAPNASNAMHVAYVSQLLHDFFGEVWNHTGKLKLRMLAPIFDGDTVTYRAFIKGSTPEGSRHRNVIHIQCVDQTGELCAAGTAEVLTSTGKF